MVILAGAFSCTVDDAGQVSPVVVASEPASRRSFEEVFVPERYLELEENIDVINVDPWFTADPTGGLLAADFRESRIRRYDSEGRLQWQIGRPGLGPGEFGPVLAVARISGDTLLAAEMTGKMSLLVEDSLRVLRVLPPYPGGLIEELDLLPSGEVLVSGRWRSGAASEGLLRVLDPTTGKVMSSFFTPSVADHLRRGAAQAGWTTSDIRGDTVATMFAFSDTIYLYGTSGDLYQRIPVHSRFVAATVSPEDFDGPVGWLRHHSQFSEIEWLPDGRFLIQYLGGTSDSPSVTPEMRYHVLLVERDGTPLVEITDNPRFYAIDGEGNIYFQDPAAMTANRLIVASLTSEFRQ